jgi:hypothetical protein
LSSKSSQYLTKSFEEHPFDSFLPMSPKLIENLVFYGNLRNNMSDNIHGVSLLFRQRKAGYTFVNTSVR